MQTEILATVGPASSGRLSELIEAGLSGIRINSSHGSLQEHLDVIRSYRELTSNGFIVYDIKGPKIRFGDLPEPLRIKPGMRITLRTDLNPSGEDTYPRIASFDQGLPLTYPLDRFVREGDRLFVDDGYVCLRVIRTRPGRIDCDVVYGDRILSRKGLNHPDTAVPFPYTMPQDLPFIAFAKEQQVDYIADSFTRNADDVAELRRRLKGTGLRIISKIENPEAVEAFPDILAATDAVMIARGDLGIEVELWRLPELQKEFIAQCNRAGKPVITATQMLESMIENPIPSRADVSDVVNALYDGTDVLMLSAETSIGKHPVRCVEMMRKIDGFVRGTRRYKNRKKRINGLARNL